jgi:hypothetical protein
MPAEILALASCHGEPQHGARGARGSSCSLIGHDANHWGRLSQPRLPTTHGPRAASFLNLRNPYFISGDAVPSGMGGRGISLVRGGGSTPTSGRGWMSTGETGLDWTTGGG